MLVKDIMTQSVKSVNIDTSIMEVSSMMCLYRYSGLPVICEGKLAGLIAEKDILYHLFPKIEDCFDSLVSINLDDKVSEFKSVVTLKVADLMTSKVISVSPDFHILKACALMVKHKFRRIPVTEDGQLVGMISLGDVHKALFQNYVAKSVKPEAVLG